ncbi:MAG: CpaF family protein [Chloroflexi bacterium]|nr:CpaF family protein [Chloroflexota bacterium]
MSLLKRIERSNQPDATGTAASTESPATKLDEIRLKRQAAVPARDATRGLKERIHDRLITELDPKIDISKTDDVRKNIETLFGSMLEAEGIVLNRADRLKLLDETIAEILGYGPIEPLLADDSITEIMVNGPKSVYIERSGKVEKTSITFENDGHVNRIIDRIVSPLGRRVDESQPYVDARLPNGSRVNIIIPPLALKGPTITIRKFFKRMLTAERLIENGSITAEAVELLKASIYARLNILISGGTGTGKTTFLNMLSSFIPSTERVITIENAAELQLQQEHVITLESKPPNIEGKGEVTQRDLMVNALRMRPDRIIVGEVRAGEALDMLQAMNTGHDGSMSTLHANTPRDALARLETMTLMAGIDLPVRAIREQVASAVQMIIQLERMRDGSRPVVGIAEVQGMEGDVIVMQDIFKYEQTGFENNKIIGRLQPTGIRPKFMEKIEAAGIHLPPEVFGSDRRRFR